MILVKRWTNRIKLLVEFSALQVLVQFISAFSGFLLVRVLSKQEFALYTIATSLQGILGVLTDSGVGSALNVVGGRVWQQREALGRLISTAFQLQLRLAWLAVPVGMASSIFLLRQQQLPWVQSILLTLVVVLGLWGMITTNLYAAPLRLHGRYLGVQTLELLAAIVRLALLGWLALGYLNALLAVLVTAFAISIQAVLVRQRAATVLDRDAPIDDSQRKELLALIQKQFFSAWFFAFQGQITIWLISVFGTTEQIAEVGALGRLAVLFALVGSVMSSLVAPTYARCDSLRRLGQLFAVSLVAYTAFAGVLMVGSLTFPREFLMILGTKYADLGDELPWLMGNSVLWGFTGVIYGLAAARGWIWHAWAIPPVTILFEILLLPLVDLSSVKGVLIFGLGSSVPAVVSAMYMALRGLWTSWKAGVIAPRAA